MAAKDKIQKAFETYMMNPMEASKMSQTWFKQQVIMMGNRVDPNKLMAGGNTDELSASTLKPGSMFLFKYKALNTGTLPYWDMFPLVIPFKAVSDGFYGLNLHYLQPQLRVQLLNGLYQFATNDKLNETTKLKFTWQMAEASSKVKYLQPCVKKYLTKQVQSHYMKVNPSAWVAMLMLPTETFVGSGKQTVWLDSRRI